MVPLAVLHSVPELMDLSQFTYRLNRGVESGKPNWLILVHLEGRINHACLLYIDFSLNCIKPHGLVYMLIDCQRKSLPPAPPLCVIKGELVAAVHQCTLIILAMMRGLILMQMQMLYSKKQINSGSV